MSGVKYTWLSWLLLIPFAAVAGAVLNRQRGTATDERFAKLPKLVIYFIMTIVIMGVLWLSGTFQIWQLWVALWAMLLGGTIMLWVTQIVGYGPSWGELFPHAYKDTSGEEYAAGVEEITNKIAGYEHTTELFETDKPSVIKWKTIAMSVRWVLYFTPQTILYCIFTLSPIPLLRCGTLALAGPIYRRYQDKFAKGQEIDPVERAEIIMGGALFATDVALLLTAGYVSTTFYGLI